MLVQMLATVFGFDDCVPGQNAVSCEPALDGAHQVGDFLLGEVLDRCIPNDVVELSLRDSGSDVSEDVLNVASRAVLACARYRRRIEVDGRDRLGLVGIEVVRHKAIAATQFQDLRQVIGSGGLQGERGVHTSFPRERGLRGRPLPMLVDEVIEILRIIRPPFDEILQPMSRRRSFAGRLTDGPRNRHEREGAFRLRVETVGCAIV